MNKFFKKLKKLISGMTALILLVSLLPIQTTLASVSQITVDSLVTSDNTPEITGTVSDPTLSVFVSINGNPEIAAVVSPDGSWGVADNLVSFLSPGEYDITVRANDGIADIFDSTTNELTIRPILFSNVVITNTTGDMDNGYTMFVDGLSGSSYQLQITNVDLWEVLNVDRFPLYISDSNVPTSELIAYYSSKPEPYKTYLEGVANGLNPVAYIKSDGTLSGVSLLDGAMWSLNSVESPMIIPGDFPEGLYEIDGTISDQDGDTLDVPFSLTISNPLTPKITENAAVNPTLITGSSVKPSVDFGVDVDVDVSYVGVCSGDITTASGLTNVVEFDTSIDGPYEGCEIVVTDRAGDTDSLLVGKYIVDMFGPTVNAGSDVKTNTSIKLEATAENAGTGITKYEWTQVSGPGVITFSDSSILNPFARANIQGEYELQLEVTDGTGLLRTAKDTMSFYWDSEVSDVKNLSIDVNDGVAKLSWDLSNDPDVDRIVIYKSEVKAERGEVLIMLTPHTVSYEDTGLEAGKPYYYTVVQVDDFGNESDGVIISGIWNETVVVASSTPVISQKTTEDKEIKSGVTDEDNKTDENSNTEVPTFGIVILVLLILLGIYLLYLQNPELFKKMAFWNKNKK